MPTQSDDDFVAQNGLPSPAGTPEEQQILTKKHTVWINDRINMNAASSVKSSQPTDYCVDVSNVRAGYNDVRPADKNLIDQQLYNFTGELIKKDGDPVRSFLGAHWFPTFELSSKTTTQSPGVTRATSEESRDFVIGGDFFPTIDQQNQAIPKWHKYDYNHASTGRPIDEASTFFPFIPLDTLLRRDTVFNTFIQNSDEVVATMLPKELDTTRGTRNLNIPSSVEGLENFRANVFKEKIKVGFHRDGMDDMGDRMDILFGKMWQLAAKVYGCQKNDVYFSDYVTEIGLPFSPSEVAASPVQMAKITQSSKGNFFPQDYMNQLDNSPDDEHFYPDYATHLISEVNKGTFSGNESTYNDVMKRIISLNSTIPQDVIDKFSILNNGKNSNINMEELGQYFNSWASVYANQFLDSPGNIISIIDKCGKNKLILPEAMNYIRTSSTDLGKINYPMLTSFDILMPCNPWTEDEHKRWKTYLCLREADILWQVLTSMHELVMAPQVAPFSEFSGEGMNNSGDIRPGFMTTADSIYIWPPIAFGQNPTSGPIQNLKSMDFYNNRHIREMLTPLGTAEERGENASFLTALSEQPEDIYNISSFHRNVLGTFDTETIVNMDSTSDDSELPSNIVHFLGSLNAGEDQNPDRFLGKIAFREDSEQGSTRNFTDVYKGEKAHSELIGYRVMKQRTDTDEVITNYFFLNDPTNPIKQIVDSQLGYSEGYTYNIFGWYMVFGTEFQYSLQGPFYNAIRNFFNHPHGQVYANTANHRSASGLQPNLTAAFKAFAEHVHGAISQDASTQEFVGMQLKGDSYPSQMNHKNSYLFDINVTSHPVVKYIELPIYMNLGGPAVVQDFPTTPVVEVVPYRNNNSEMLFLINSGPGSMSGLPVQIEQSDYEHIFKKYKSEITDDKFELLKFLSSVESDKESSASDFAPYFLNYESKVIPKYFQIFRTDFKPTSYIDFAGTSLVDTDGVPGLVTNGVASTSFKDSIEPNRKYYYTFRAVDSFGQPSPPTPVYEVELVDDSGTIYPLINIVEFDNTAKIKTGKKTVRKYLHLSPALENTLLENYAAAVGVQGAATTAGKFIDARGEPYLGSKDQFNLFGREEDEVLEMDYGVRNYYKIRLTSKKTGRQFDVNVNCKTKHNTTKEEIKSKNNAS